jgi:hypothetical protein
MTKRWEKLGIEDRKKVIDAVFGSWGRYMAGAEEVSIGGINVTREQLDSLRDLMSRHDKYRQHGGEIEALTQAAKDMDEFRREIARIVDAPVWDDISCADIDPTQEIRRCDCGCVWDANEWGALCPRCEEVEDAEGARSLGRFDACETSAPKHATRSTRSRSRCG